MHLRERVVEGGAGDPDGATHRPQAGQGARRGAGRDARGAAGRSTTRARCAPASGWRPGPAGCIPGGCPGPGRPGRETRDLPPVPAESFRDWWQRTARRDRGPRGSSQVSSREWSWRGCAARWRTCRAATRPDDRPSRATTCACTGPVRARRPWTCSRRTSRTTGRVVHRCDADGLAATDRPAAGGRGAPDGARAAGPGRRVAGGTTDVDAGPDRATSTPARNWTPWTAWSRAARSPSPRPAPSSWTPAPTRAGAGSPWCRTTTSASSASPDQVVGSVPQGLPRLRPGPPADLDLRARPRPATSNSTGSRGCTGRARWRWFCWRSEQRQGRARSVGPHADRTYGYAYRLSPA